MALLAETKRKTKFGLDPRNTTWSNDDSKFGQKLMERMGWSKGKGLGAHEDGMTDHVKASYKSDTRGLGSTPKDADAWIAHQDDFNDLLKKLNSENAEEMEPAKTEDAHKADGRKRFYGRFARGRVPTLRSTEDLDCIFGKRKSTPSTDQTSNGSSNSSEEDDDGDTETDKKHGLTTVTRTESVQEYFAKKMAQKRSIQANDTEDSRSTSPNAAGRIPSENNENSRVPAIFGTVAFSYDDVDSEQRDSSTHESSKNAEHPSRGWYNEWHDSSVVDKSGEGVENSKSKKKKKKKRSAEGNSDTENLLEEAGEKEKKSSASIEEKVSSDESSVVSKKKKRKLEEVNVTNETSINNDNDAEIINKRSKKKSKKEKVDSIEVSEGNDAGSNDKRKKRKKEKSFPSAENEASDNSVIVEKKSKGKRVSFNLPNSDEDSNNNVTNESCDNAKKKRKNKNKIAASTQEDEASSSEPVQEKDRNESVDNEDSKIIAKKSKSGKKRKHEDVTSSMSDVVDYVEKKKECEIGEKEESVLESDQAGESDGKCKKKKRKSKKKKKQTETKKMSAADVALQNAFKGSNISEISGYGQTVAKEMPKNKKKSKRNKKQREMDKLRKSQQICSDKN